MKKLISALLSLIIVMSTIAVPAMAEDNIKVTLNGQEIQFDVQPQIINERTMVPVRAIFEALGASVEWDQTTQTVTSKKGDTTISLAIDNPVMMVNDEQVTLDQSACIIDERTLVPVRAISEAYGTTVDWDQITKTVSITTSDYVAPSVVYYDDISANVNQIRDMISRGLYVEAMQECENAKNWHNLSPDDIALVDGLKSTAQSKYNNYLENAKKKQDNNYYPGTSIPTYTSITGVNLKKQSSLSDGTPVYMYRYTSASVVGDYWKALTSRGWSQLRGDDTKTQSTFESSFYKGSSLIIVNVYLDTDEVWITYSL